MGVAVSLSREGGVVAVCPFAKELPTASWKIAVETSPVRIARMAVHARFFAVILPPESELNVQPVREIGA
jgi:hypothetical protein